ncbi:hypothetical protein K8I61_02040 [bacterium]|nr:hypothetical protein [bacterium]
MMIVMAVSLTASAALAQDVEDNLSASRHVYDKNLHYFQPPTDGSGLILAWGSEPIGHIGFHIGALADYAHRPMEYTDPQDVTHTVIYNQTGVNAMFGVGLWDALNISGSYVFIPNRSFNQTYQEIYKWGDSGTGDARASVKGIITNRRTDGIGIAVLAEAGLGNGDEIAFISDEQMTVMPRVIFDFGNEWYTYVLNLGYKIYPDGIDGGLFDIPSGDEYLANTGLTFRVLWGLEFVGELAWRMYSGESDLSRSYTEALGALRSTWFTDNPVRLTFGASSGLTDAVGTPIFRVFGGFNFFFRELGLP